ncbi:MAG: hypothetical protein MUF64_09255 [Polyangiaceae bacterium]|jgi:hypothetical protein|nr:hypothetical protein [Polyangiaceae bacterium]
MSDPPSNPPPEEQGPPSQVFNQKMMSFFASIEPGPVETPGPVEVPSEVPVEPPATARPLAPLPPAAPALTGGSRGLLLGLVALLLVVGAGAALLLLGR